jgi:hypothetical protein
MMQRKHEKALKIMDKILNLLIPKIDEYLIKRLKADNF